MLTVKEINEVSFGKANFSGYKPEDVDRFIDEVADSFQELETQRDEAVGRLQELSSQNASLSQKNAELQKKLSVLAQKVESYRQDEDSIKEAIISAQKLARDSVAEANTRAQSIMAEAEENARKLVEDAKMNNYKVIQSYASQTEEKRQELEEMKRQVSAFRSSLMEMYKKHLECIDHIPNFKTRPPVDSADPVQKQAVSTAEEPKTTKTVLNTTEIPSSGKPVSQQRDSVPAKPEGNGKAVQNPSNYRPQHSNGRGEPDEPTLDDKVNYAERSGAASTDLPPEDDLTEMGIDIRSYSSIPESLQKEKENHYNTLEFGDDVDLGNRRRRR